MLATVRMLRRMVRRPLNRGRSVAALTRYLRWQIGSRLVGAPIAHALVEDTRILVSTGMVGATQCIYVGLPEFEDMAFVLHALRPGDLFVDVGANVGVYTMLAYHTGADCIAFEPAPLAYGALARNIALNNAAARVAARQEAVGSTRGSLHITTGEDCTNHVAVEGDSGTVEVPVSRIDDLPRVPLLIKIDVEGFESEVLAGAERTLASPDLLAVIIETNGGGRRYGRDDGDIDAALTRSGLTACAYDPFRRILTPAPPRPLANTIYVRGLEAAQRRVSSVRQFRVHGRLV